MNDSMEIGIVVFDAQFACNFKGLYIDLFDLWTLQGAKPSQIHILQEKDGLQGGSLEKMQTSRC